DAVCSAANGTAVCGDKNFCISPVSHLPCNATNADCAFLCNTEGVLDAHNAGKSCTSKAGNGLALCGADALCLGLPDGGTACATKCDICQCKPTNAVKVIQILQSGAGGW